MPAKFCDAYDTKTGQKLPHKVPETHFALFKNIAPTPKQRAASAAVFVRPANADTEKEK